MSLRKSLSSLYNPLSSKFKFFINLFSAGDFLEPQETPTTFKEYFAHNGQWVILGLGICVLMYIIKNLVSGCQNQEQITSTIFPGQNEDYEKNRFSLLWENDPYHENRQLEIDKFQNIVSEKMFPRPIKKKEKIIPVLEDIMESREMFWENIHKY